MEPENQDTNYVDVHVDNGLNAFRVAHKRYVSFTEWLSEHSFGMLPTVARVNQLFILISLIFFSFAIWKLVSFTTSNSAPAPAASTLSAPEPARP